jgi:hypothetical protein
MLSVGVARYFRQAGADSAELAVVVADDWQRQGLATCMVSGREDRTMKQWSWKRRLACWS